MSSKSDTRNITALSQQSPQTDHSPHLNLHPFCHPTVPTLTHPLSSEFRTPTSVSSTTHSHSYTPQTLLSTGVLSRGRRRTGEPCQPGRTHIAGGRGAVLRSGVVSRCRGALTRPPAGAARSQLIGRVCRVARPPPTLPPLPLPLPSAARGRSWRWVFGGGGGRWSGHG